MIQDGKSLISSSGFQGQADPTTFGSITRSGTGGVIFCAVENLKINQGNQGNDTVYFKAEGSYLEGQTKTMLGGGGRIYMEVQNKPAQDIIEFVSVKGFLWPDSSVLSNSGTIYIIDQAKTNHIFIRNLQSGSILDAT